MIGFLGDRSAPIKKLNTKVENNIKKIIKNEDKKLDEIQRKKDVKRFSNQMFGIKDVFHPLLDFEDRKISWKEISDILL